MTEWVTSLRAGSPGRVRARRHQGMMGAPSVNHAAVSAATPVATLRSLCRAITWTPLPLGGRVASWGVRGLRYGERTHRLLIHRVAR